MARYQTNFLSCHTFFLQIFFFLCRLLSMFSLSWGMQIRSRCPVFFISHKMDILFAGHANIAPSIWNSLTRVATNLLTKTNSVHRNNFNFIQFHPCFRVDDAIMLLNVDFTYHRMARWLFLPKIFNFVLTSHRTLTRDQPVAKSFVTQVLHADTFDLVLFFLSLASYAMAFWLCMCVCVCKCVAVTSNIHIYLESSGLYFDLCIQYWSVGIFCVEHWRVLIAQLSEWALLEATNHSDIVLLPAKIIWKYIPFNLTRKIFTNLLVVCYILFCSLDCSKGKKRCSFFLVWVIFFSLSSSLFFSV